jgi:hypothetical protein
MERDFHGFPRGRGILPGLAHGLDRRGGSHKISAILLIGIDDIAEFIGFRGIIRASVAEGDRMFADLHRTVGTIRTRLDLIEVENGRNRLFCNESLYGIRINPFHADAFPYKSIGYVLLGAFRRL